jgi:predicted AlkP superfamily phosphohydrolase/phosphomutase
VEFYERVDEVLGGLRERLDEDTTLIVAADHGFCTLDYEVDLNAWLRDEGWQSIADDGDSLDDITEDTRVYSLIPGRFYVNLEGREPEGAVPEEEYDETLEELEDALHALEDPDGNAVVERVVRKDEIGEDADETAPDLVAIPTRGHDLKAGFDTDKGVFSKGARNGMHTFDDASLLIEGADVDTEGVDITDVAPTVLDLLDVEANGMDGESMVQ